MLHLCGATRLNVTLVKLMPSSEVRHGSPAVTSNVHQVSQRCYRNSSGIHFNNVELVAESFVMLYCIRNGLVAIPASAYLHLATAHTRGSVTRYRHIQCNTNTYSHIFFTTAIFACGVLYRLTFANCHQTAWKLTTELSPAYVNACQPCFYPLHCTVFIGSSLLPFAQLRPLYAHGPSHLVALLLNLSWHLSGRRKKKKFVVEGTYQLTSSLGWQSTCPQ